MINDPIERIVFDALAKSQLTFTHEGQPKKDRPHHLLPLDFHITDINIYIEVKAYSTERSFKQLSGLENVILIQGKQAALGFASLLQELVGAI